MANNTYVNKVEYGNETLMDITDTTAEAGDVLEGEVFYTKSGARSVGTLGDATTSTHGLMSATDKTKLDGITTMTGATSLTAGASGLVPAPTTSDVAKFLRGDGAWQEPPKNAVILSYGISTYQDFLAAFNAGAVIYCKGSAYANPSEGDQVRYAYMSYVNSNATQAEFIYYKVSSHSYNNICDELFIYKLDSSTGWSVLNVPIGSKQILSSTDCITTAYSENRITISASAFVGATSQTAGTAGLVPAPATTDVGKFLCSDGTWAIVSGGGSGGGGGGIIGITLASTSLAPDANGVVTIPAMGACTASTNGSVGAVPAPSAGDQDKFLSGDGTWKAGGLPMVILSYGSSTWSSFINAYNNNVIVYCRASSGDDPSVGSQTRMAFMAYVNNESSPTEVEFQYYRSVSSHKYNAMGDEVYVYKLNSSTGWSVTKRYASLREIINNSTAITVSYNSNKITIADA